MRNIKTTMLLLIFCLVFSFTAIAQKTQEQTDLIETINTKIKNAALTKNHLSSIRLWKREFRILNKFGTTKSTVNIDKIRNIKIVKQDKYYSIKIVAPWGVTVPNSKTKFGSTQIGAGMKNKKLVKDIISDIKTLVDSYQSE